MFQIKLTKQQSVSKYTFWKDSVILQDDRFSYLHNQNIAKSYRILVHDLV